MKTIVPKLLKDFIYFAQSSKIICGIILIILSAIIFTIYTMEPLKKRKKKLPKPAKSLSNKTIKRALKAQSKINIKNNPMYSIDEHLRTLRLRGGTNPDNPYSPELKKMMGDYSFTVLKELKRVAGGPLTGRLKLSEVVEKYYDKMVYAIELTRFLASLKHRPEMWLPMPEDYANKQMRLSGSDDSLLSMPVHVEPKYFGKLNSGDDDSPVGIQNVKKEMQYNVQPDLEISYDMKAQDMKQSVVNVNKKHKRFFSLSRRKKQSTTSSTDRTGSSQSSEEVTKYMKYQPNKSSQDPKCETIFENNPKQFLSPGVGSRPAASVTKGKLSPHFQDEYSPRTDRLQTNFHKRESPTSFKYDYLFKDQSPISSNNGSPVKSSPRPVPQEASSSTDEQIRATKTFWSHPGAKFKSTAVGVSRFGPHNNAHKFIKTSTEESNNTITPS